MSFTDLAYRKTALEGASGFGYLIALYDTLVGDLRRAAAAQREGDLERRSRELKHALLVVSFLQNFVEPDSGELAQQLYAFYAHVRSQILDAQARQSPEMLEDLMTAALGLRQMWQRLDLRDAEQTPEILPPAGKPAKNGFLSTQFEQRQFSWSA